MEIGTRKRIMMMNSQATFIRSILYPYLYFPACLPFSTFFTGIDSQTPNKLHLNESASRFKKNEDSIQKRNNNLSDD